MRGATTAAQPTVMLQGVETPVASVDPESFFANTRRLLFPMRSITPIAGLGSSDPTQLRQTGVVAGLEVRVTGSLVFGGTITGTTMSWRWPYNLIKALRVSANGQANLINANGLQLKARSMMQPDSQDRGVARNINNVAIQQGSLSLGSEDWGTSGSNLLGPGRTVPATGTYTFDLAIYVPIAFDQKTLLGAIYAQTAATQLSLDIDWETQANLVTLGGAATLATPTINYQVTGIVYSIPNVGGRFVVPDLSSFHSLIGFRTSAIAQGDNEVLLPGTGIGRQLLRTFFQVYTGTAPGSPLAMNATNYGQLGWRYGGNDTPELVANGTQLRYLNERLYNADVGGQWGVGCWDFANEWAFRDSVDEGQTSDLRLLINLQAAPTTPYAEIVQETLFAAPVGA
jgi:hypothetical protein